MTIIGDWVNRQRHNRGYGIQSPSTFFFITQVLKERLPYYSYPILNAIAEQEKSISKKHARELFRITNHYRPESIIAAGSPVAACAMTMARPAATKFSIGNAEPSAEVAEVLEAYGCTIKRGDTGALLEESLTELGRTSMLYIGYGDNYAELFDIALKHVNERSIIVIEGIHRDKAIKRWWQEVVNNPTTILTHDFYSYGIVLFNSERRKQHYTFKR